MKFFKHDDLELEDRLSAIFLFTGGIMSLFAFVLGIIFGVPFLLNMPHMVVCTICIGIPLFFKKI